MPSKHVQSKSSVHFEELLNQQILLFKTQKLCVRKKFALDERHKRLNTDFNIVDGRKLDHERCSLNSKCTKVHNVNREKAPRIDVQGDDSEALKSFKFAKPMENSAKLDAVDLLSDLLGQLKVKIQSELEEQPKDNYMYFVLDTNVLLDDRYMLDDVAKLTLSGTWGSVLYVPYMVIKELDTLKSRDRSFAARQAIEYLNNKFSDLEHIEAQSPLADAKPLIDIDSPDDSIINCCLQLKAEREHVMLLTNDKNMRLKAFASAIQVTSCYQLTSSRSNWWSLPRERRVQRRHKYRVI